MVQGQEEGLKNRGGGGLALFLFNYFKVYHFVFINCLTFCKIVL